MLESIFAMCYKNAKQRVQQAALISAFLFLSACATSGPRELAVDLDPAQGSANNIASLTRVVNANPNSPEAYNVRGSAFGQAGRNREAIEDFSKAIQLNPRFYQAYANRALIYRQTGDPSRKTQQAFRDYERAIQLGTTNPRAYHSRGLMLQSNGQHDLAIQDFTSAISLAPDAAEPYNARGASYIATNDNENAWADINKALNLDSSYAEARAANLKNSHF